MLNAKGRTGAPTKLDLAAYDLSKEDFQNLIKSAFPEMGDVFGSGIGTKLMRAESDIMEAILLHFASEGIPALPIHDSVIISADRKDDLLKVMISAFKEKMRTD